MDSNSNIKINQSELALRMRVFRSALIFVAIAASYFAYNNYFVSSNNSKIYACFELALAVYAVSLLWLAKDSKHFKLHCNLFLLSFAAIVCYGAATTSYKAGLYVWLFVFPVMSYLLLGSKQGFITTFVYLLAGVGISLWRLYLSDESIHPIAIANFSLSFFVIWAMSHTYEFQRKKALWKLNQLAVTDSLTGLKNRLDLQEIFIDLKARHESENQSFGLAIIDIDYFKSLNDQYGHDSGDRVLQKFAQLVKKNLRENDLAFRVGGEEFCFLLPNSSKETALSTLERVRKAIEKFEFVHEEHHMKITISIGVAEFSQDGDDFKKLYHVADERLYRAKTAGRNQVVHETTIEMAG